MGRYRELLKDFSLLTISNFGSKLLSFLLVPLYTAVLSTEEYGSYDVINVTISLLIPILTIGIIDAPARFLLDKKDNKDQIFTISLKICLWGTLIFLGISVVNNIFNIVPIFNRFYIYFILLFISSVFYRLAQSLARGMDKLVYIAVSGIVNSVLVLSLNIYFLLNLKMGLDGYFLANIIAIVVPTIYLFVRLRFFSRIKPKKRDEKLKKEMISYSKPMVLNSIGWWINNVSDRYVITLFLGVAADGIYSVAYKIPSILSTMQSIFGQAWTISATKTMDKEDRGAYFSNIYNTYNSLMVISCSGLIVCAKLIAGVLYQNDFYSAWSYTPFLLISSVFGAMSGVLGGIFAASKNTKVMGRTTIIGAIVNTILNVILVVTVGVGGAAFSTMVSYVIVWAIRYRKVRRHTELSVKIWRDLLGYGLLLIQAVILLIAPDEVMYLLNTPLIVIELFLYKGELKKMSGKVAAKIRRKSR